MSGSLYLNNYKTSFLVKNKNIVYLDVNEYYDWFDKKNYKLFNFVTMNYVFARFILY